LFPNVKEASDKLGFGSVDDFSAALLEEANVAVVPGSGFGASDYIRLSYATSLDLLEKAIDRINEFVSSRLK
jgi:aspartate aminotransferase